MDLLEALDARIAALQKQLETLLAARKLIAGDAPPPKPEGKISAAGKAAIAKAQRERWAKIKAAKKGDVMQLEFRGVFPLKRDGKCQWITRSEPKPILMLADFKTNCPVAAVHSKGESRRAGEKTSIYEWKRGGRRFAHWTQFRSAKIRSRTIHSPRQRTASAEYRSIGLSDTIFCP